MLKVDLIGQREFLDRIANAGKELQAKIGHEVQAAGYEYVKLAKRDLVAQSSDTGGLLNSTIVQPVDAMNIDVRVEKFYAAFIEFGTKGKYKAIPGTEEIAAKMRGYKRGNFKEFVKAIEAWVKRKGFAATYNIKTRRRRKDKGEAERTEQAAWAIAISLARHGMKPKPFFFKQIPIVREKFQKRAKQILDEL